MAKSVRDSMTDNPRSIGASASVVEAAQLMRTARGARGTVHPPMDIPAFLKSTADTPQLVGTSTGKDVT
jgi:hypothetical protein